MYLKFEDVILVGNHDRVDSEDPVIYVRDYDGQRILTFDNASYPHTRIGEATRYGQLYYASEHNPCVVPDEWTWDDAHKCKDCIPPDEEKRENREK